MNKDTIWIAICLIACLPLIYLIVIACLSNGKRGAQPKTDPDPARFAESVPTSRSLDKLTLAYVEAQRRIESGEVSQDDFRALMNAYGEYINAEVVRGR
jgi:hypothetical protein